MLHKVILQKGNVSKKAYIGVSTTILLFGPFVPLFRGDFKWTLILLLSAVVTLGTSNIIFASLYNEIHLKNLLRDGYVLSDETVKSKVLKFIPDAFESYVKPSNFCVLAFIFSITGAIMNLWLGFLSIPNKGSLSFASFFDKGLIESLFSDIYSELSGTDFIFTTMILIIAINIFLTHLIAIFSGIKIIISNKKSLKGLTWCIINCFLFYVYIKQFGSEIIEEASFPTGTVFLYNVPLIWIGFYIASAVCIYIDKSKEAF